MLADRRVAARPAAPRFPGAIERAGVHDAEARGLEGHEHDRVLDDGVGDAFAASEAGGDQNRRRSLGLQGALGLRRPFLTA